MIYRVRLRVPLALASRATNGKIAHFSHFKPQVTQIAQNYLFQLYLLSSWSAVLVGV